MSPTTTSRSACLPPPRLAGLDRDTLEAYFVDTWELYEWLFSAIRTDRALYDQPDPLRQPLLFYLGHTAAFYINKLRLAGLREKPIHERFEELFAVGVDPATAGELESEIWPEADEVRRYRRRVYEEVLELIRTVDIPDRIGDDDPLWALLMGLEHDRIHFETSSVLIRQYPPDDVARPGGWEYAPIDGGVAPGALVEIPGGEVVLGKPDGFPTFGWDNEYGRLETFVDGFRASPTLVTNAEFLEFVREGGYEREDLWSEEGRAWKAAQGARHPKFWVERDGALRYRAMFDELEMPGSWPVEVNRLEADAYLEWRGSGWRLPSEAEFARMARNAPLADGDSVFTDVYNLSVAYGSPTPVGFMEDGRTGDGIHDLYGNVWDWLSDDFYALPGFETHPLYEDFSAPYMDADHGMMAGGAWASSGTSASRFYRLWFRRFFFQHAGFRAVRDA